MNNKEIKILSILVDNSRITTKELGKVLNTSQQSANYLLHKIESEDYFLGYKALIDPAKFGLINVIVFYNYTDFKAKKEIIECLKEHEYVTRIEECSQGYDLEVEFTVANLSFFNKQNKNVLLKFKNKLVQMEIFPVIVKHNFLRKYYSLGVTETDRITSGDRDVEDLSTREKLFLKEIQENARNSVINIAEKIKSNPKTIIQLKKRMEDKKIVRRYGVSLNTPAMGIFRSQILVNLQSQDLKESKRFIEFLKNQKGVVYVQKVIGRFEMLITIESFDFNDKTFENIRQNFSIMNYKIIKNEGVIKEKSIPLIYLK